MKKELKWLLLVGGIFSIIAGIYMIMNPGISLASLAIFFSVVLLFNGVAEIVQYFTNKENRNGWLLTNGILTVLLAVWMLSSNFLSFAMFIPYLVAFWVLFAGITRIFISFRERKENKSGANHHLFIGILGILGGIGLLMFPLFTGFMVAYMIGFGFLYQGCVKIFLFFKSEDAN